MTTKWVDTAAALKETGCSSSYDLTTQGEVVEGEIDAELDMNHLDTNPPDDAQSGTKMLKKAAQMWLCRNIRILQKHDMTLPPSVREGALSIDTAIDVSIKYYDDKGREALDKYILSQTGTDSDETEAWGGLLALAGEG